MKIQRKVLELISKEVAKFMTWKQIVEICTECKVPVEIIQRYTEQCQAKWFLLYNIMGDLSDSENENFQQINLEIIKKVVHPLVFSGDENACQEIIDRFNNWLKYDNLQITKCPDGIIDAHNVWNMTDQDKKDILDEIEDNTKRVYRIIKASSLDELTILRKSYQLLINIIDTYSENIRNPNDTLNDYYIRLLKIANESRNQIIACFAQAGGEFGLRVGFNDHFPDIPLYHPFPNLYSAQAIIRKEELKRETIKIKMYEYLGTISDLYLECGASDILTESNVQKLFNDISLYLSELKEQRSRDLSDQQSRTVLNQKPTFDDKESVIYFKDKKIEIPYSSNQYNLCKAVFGNPKKRWENDELLDKFGLNSEEIQVKRQPYDAMIAINKKVEDKTGVKNLILCKRKTFSLNNTI
ncbi:MAG: hypothetical protein V1808_01470 [Candidatus Daviesbacteria bacterium]